MNVRWILFGLMAIGQLANAQQIHKCVQGNSVTYQSAACPGQAVRSWDASPQLEDPAITRHNQQVQQLVDARNATQQRGAALTRPQSAQIASSKSDSTCEQSRAQRKAAYERAGLRRTFAMSRHWDGVVSRACR
jgi:hypothetical protein